MNTRHHEKFYVPHAKTDRFAKSAIPYMARLLNVNVKWMEKHVPTCLWNVFGELLFIISLDVKIKG